MADAHEVHFGLPGRAGERIALAADGQGRFFANSHVPTGNMIVRRRLLAARGWAVLSVPYYLWAELSEDLRRAWLLQARGICRLTTPYPINP